MAPSLNTSHISPMKRMHIFLLISCLLRNQGRDEFAEIRAFFAFNLMATQKRTRKEDKIANSNLFSWHFMFRLLWMAAHPITSIVVCRGDWFLLQSCFFSFSPFTPVLDIKVCIFLISNSHREFDTWCFFSIFFSCIASMTTTKHDNKMQQSTNAQSEKFIGRFDSFIIHSFTTSI